MKRPYSALVTALTIGALVANAHGAAFTPGNLVIYRLGVVNDGSNPGPTADSVFVDEYTTATGQTVPVQSFAIPTTTIGSQRRLTGQGNATLEGLINRTTNGQYVLFTGYDAALGLSTPATTLASNVNRVIGRIDVSGNVDTSTIISDLDGGADANPTQSGSPRSAMSTNGTDIYIVGAESGVRRTTFGSTAASTQVSDLLGVTDLRHVDIFGGGLYASTGVVGPNGVQQINLTTGAMTGLAPIPGGTTSGDAQQFFMADLSTDVPGIDTIYLTDGRSQAEGGGLRKYALNGTTGQWDAKGGVFGVPGAGGNAVSVLRGLTGTVDGSGNVTLYGTRNTSSSGSAGAGQLLKFSDNTGHDGTMSGIATLLATAQVNTRFLGVDFAPVAPTPVAGDYNGNGVVDAADYVVWRKNQGGSGGSSSVGDSEPDGDVDDADYAYWQSRFGNGTPANGILPGLASVPEPATVSLLPMTAAMLFFATRRPTKVVLKPASLSLGDRLTPNWRR